MIRRRVPGTPLCCECGEARFQVIPLEDGDMLLTCSRCCLVLEKDEDRERSKLLDLSRYGRPSI